MLYNDRLATPGTGWLAEKFLREKRSLYEFQEGQYILRTEYERCKREKEEWPKNDEEYTGLLSYLFGERESESLKKTKEKGGNDEGARVEVDLGNIR